MVFIPLYDDNPFRHLPRPYVNYALIAVTIASFFLTGGLDEYAVQSAAMQYGFIPSAAGGLEALGPEYKRIPEKATYLTYAFLHANWAHLLGNMAFLWVFGDNVEDALGHFKFLIFYLLCAIAGAWLHGVIAPDSEVPLIGASGAIAGVVAAYLILHPRVKIWILAFGRIPLRIPAYITLALWILFQFTMFAIGGDEQVSFACHVGGIIAGAVLVVFLRSRDVPLFDREIVTPRAVVIKQPSAVRPVEAKPAPRWGRQ